MRSVSTDIEKKLCTPLVKGVVEDPLLLGCYSEEKLLKFKKAFEVLCLQIAFVARDGIRTRMPCSIRPSSVRVCQFHHPSRRHRKLFLAKETRLYEAAGSAHHSG
jgi:hypothetical protein